MIAAVALLASLTHSSAYAAFYLPVAVGDGPDTPLTRRSTSLPQFRAAVSADGWRAHRPRLARDFPAG